MEVDQGWSRVSAPTIQVLRVLELKRSSVSIMFDTVPWLSYYLKRLPGIGKDLKRLHDMAFGRTRSRYRYGSSLKDVFYYLVSFDPSSKTDVFILIGLT